MEGAKFISLLKRQKVVLIGLPILVMAISFVLLRKLPNQYAAKTTLSSGLVDGAQPLSLERNILQDSKISQQFSNLMQMMQMKKVFDQISYKLIIHDLENPPFKKPSKLFGQLNANAKKHALDVYKHHYLLREPLDLTNADQRGLDEVINSMGYGYDKLMKKMKVYRIETSDFITIEFESDSAMLSSFVVNTLADEFIRYYNTITRESESRTLGMLDTLLNQKKDSLENKVNELKDFKISNHVLNSDELAKTLYSQMSKLEGDIELVQKNIESDKGALQQISDKLQNKGYTYNDSANIVLNQRVISLKAQLSNAVNEYYANGINIKYKPKVDSLKDLLDKEMTRVSDKDALNPMAAKSNLLQQKIQKEIDIEMAERGLVVLVREYEKLNTRLDLLVPKEAAIQSFNNNINVASQEYIELMKKHSQTSMAYNQFGKLRIIEVAQPGLPLPSKKLLLMALSGIVSFILCIITLFVIFYFDESIQVAFELANKTQLPVLGYIPVLPNAPLLHLNQFWENGNLNDERKEFKNLLRSVRFETEMQMEGFKTLAVTSLRDGEGKSFLAMALATAYVMVNKRVLLIDGNFNKPTITKMAHPNLYLEDVLTARSLMPRPGYSNDVTILGNHGADTSLFEVNNEENIRRKFEDLKELFDVVIIESTSLDTLNQAKEWFIIADRTLGVFEPNKSLTFKEKQYIEYLKSQPGKFMGWILNKTDNTFPDSRNYFKKKKRK